ncbi:MAG: hypothetical protein ACI3VN_04550 [Candidatus Onthomonas sp.]
MEAYHSGTLTSIRRQERISILLTCLLGVLLFFLSFLMSYHLLHDLGGSDLQAHLDAAKKLTKVTVFTELLTGKERLWHLGVKIFMWLKVSGVYSACLMTAVSVAAYYGICCGVLKKTLTELNQALIPAASFALCMMGPIFMPWYSERIYRGQDTPNVWHNPTQLMLRPFALLTVLMTVRIYQRLRQGDWPKQVYESRWEAAVYTGVITLGVWAKPSYFQAAVPALGILMVVDLIRSRGKSLLPSVKVAAAYIPGAVFTLMRFINAFYTGEKGGGIEIAPFDVWSDSSNIIPVSILLLYAFPLFVLLLDWRSILPSVEGQLSLAMLLTSGAMKALLAEVGARRYHGNFGWAWGITATLVWFFAFRRFLKLMAGDRLPPKKYRIAAYVGWTLLALHLLSGIVYYCVMVTGNIEC